MTNTSDGWDFEGYWSAVLGAYRDADGVVWDFDLDPTDERGLDQWLGEAEVEAWRVGGDGGPMPACWTQFHAMALAELRGLPGRVQTLGGAS